MGEGFEGVCQEVTPRKAEIRIGMCQSAHYLAIQFIK